MGKHKIRRTRESILPTAQKALDALSVLGDVHLCGSFRRNEETVSDVDILLCPERAITIEDMKSCLLTKFGCVSWEENKRTVRNAFSVSDPAIGGSNVDVDVWCIGKDRIGAGLLYTTGCGLFNVVMRRYALYKDLFLRVDGVYDVDMNLVAGATEKDCFNALGWDFVEPIDRGRHIFQDSIDKHIQEIINFDAISHLEEMKQCQREK